MAHSTTNPTIELTQDQIDKFWSLVDDSEYGPAGCWVWQAYRNKQSYGVINTNCQRFLAHRFSWFLVHGNIPDDLIACHRCDNPSCVNPSHVWLGTRQQNALDRDSKKRVASGNNHGLRKNAGAASHGERHYLAKLTTDSVVLIRKLYQSGQSCKDIASNFDVTDGAILAVVLRKTWKHVK